ncbi:hypothetical protein JM946_01205 [Steroidobacter sp. S1-65]|uniref:Cryptochrome/DNA photolyase FAD-binding domain-containing protein n=1 Tax=Steroidobacter gossypii TaxID=2805490 RepID=A0ABS1WQT2_9GAMM|nr:hypothetical protein [Steroidobacter gossypii]
MRGSRADLRAWQRGLTGIPLIDAGMRELWRTGWMHNRVRMIVASLLTRNLQIHWLERALVLLWNTLVDANLANNTCGWPWVAGCRTRRGFDASGNRAGRDLSVSCARFGGIPQARASGLFPAA